MSTLAPQAPQQTRRAMTPEEHRRSALVARCIYGLVIVAFVTVCTVAVVVSSNMERTKPGFKAITVTKPISVIDTTYLKQPASTSQTAH